MADECPQTRLQREVMCSVCLELFTDPYRVDCGHSFCRACISQCLAETSAEATCPQCRVPIQPQNFTPNKDMARFVEIVKQMSGPSVVEAGRKDICEAHQEPLKYFCKTDQVHICPVCDKSESHEGHDTVPVEAAAQELKGCETYILRAGSGPLRAVIRPKNQTRQPPPPQSRTGMLKMAEGKDKIMTSFLVLREFLVDAEILVCNEVSRLINEIVRTQEGNMRRGQEKLTSFNHILERMEEMCRLPEEELMQQAGSNWQRWVRETFDRPVAYSPALKWKVWELCDIHNFLENAISQLRVLFDSGYRLQYQKVNVTLDPATAYPKLLLSGDCRTVKWDDQSQDMPDNPLRFDSCYCVLGCEGYSSGRLYWDVDVGTEGNWAIGVAKESSERKGELVLNSENGIYAIGKCGDTYWAFEEINVTFPWKPLKPVRIRVFLDYVGAGVTFFNADHAVELFEFRENSFGNERLYPFFWLQKGSQLKIHP
uniref:E3 ubiquitin-protein ligase TRIM7-like n=1 Tax=Euleptes europaea TaxID=460621 RepID=UPI00253F7BAB|nr:E3 ubiquitin-protein ligase TRIM7-like [Euleptes europaea]